ncbi:hypothetical protein GCM10007977_070870 [Dactylosporangium sucinum]|uniref:Uncharacterized protein n=1 Tax=Dactylosporangium sucinum TaxID=1424081 RepID=A0A917X352_9ACTN|nr:hypothetical protein GCM10007977_070870 [Dactylosporangium sucinum]
MTPRTKSASWTRTRGERLGQLGIGLPAQVPGDQRVDVTAAAVVERGVPEHLVRPVVAEPDEGGVEGTATEVVHQHEVPGGERRPGDRPERRRHGLGQQLDLGEPGRLPRRDHAMRARVPVPVRRRHGEHEPVRGLGPPGDGPQHGDEVAGRIVPVAERNGGVLFRVLPIGYRGRTHIVQTARVQAARHHDERPWSGCRSTTAADQVSASRTG